jgi:hypothetical protein
MTSMNYFDSGMSNGANTVVHFDAKNCNAWLRLKARLKQFMRRRLTVLSFIMPISSRK